MQGLVLVSFLLAQAPTPLDLGELRPKLMALTDGHGRYFMLDPAAPYGEMLFSGDGKKMFQSRVVGGGKNGDESWSVTFWEPRIPLSAGRPDLAMKDEGRVYELTCGKKITKLTLVPEDELKPLVASAVFLPMPWTRYPDRLMRDDAGNYFFIDRLRTEERQDRRDFRVFKGPRGKMKQLPLKDIVDDSEGTIFATKDGTLRLISSAGGAPKSLKWVVGKKETPLTEVPVEDNVRMIYLDLGPYSGQPLGTPCDGFL